MGSWADISFYYVARALTCSWVDVHAPPPVKMGAGHELREGSICETYSIGEFNIYFLGFRNFSMVFLVLLKVQHGFLMLEFRA